MRLNEKKNGEKLHVQQIIFYITIQNGVARVMHAEEKHCTKIVRCDYRLYCMEIGSHIVCPFRRHSHFLSLHHEAQSLETQVMRHPSYIFSLQRIVCMCVCVNS